MLVACPEEDIGKVKSGKERVDDDLFCFLTILIGLYHHRGGLLINSSQIGVLVRNSRILNDHVVRRTQPLILRVESWANEHQRRVDVKGERRKKNSRAH